MHCPLCGTENSTKSERCQLCDTPLKRHRTVTSPKQSDTIFVDPVDTSQMRISRTKLAIAVAILILIAAPWMMMSSLLKTPDDIVASRRHYNDLRHRYLTKQQVWSDQKNQILAAIERKQSDDEVGAPVALFEGLPLEVALAHLYEDLGFDSKAFEGVALYPNDDLRNPTLVLSKYQKGVWPLSIVVSLELRLKRVNGKWTVDYQRLRRGSRDIAPTLAWVYFLPELKALSKLEALAGGVQSLSLFRPADGSTAPQLSWSYRRRQPMPTS